MRHAARRTCRWWRREGLLHRLAARAAGTAVAVRSDAGLPFRGGSLGADEEPAAEPVVDLPTAAAPLGARVQCGDEEVPAPSAAGAEPRGQCR